MGRGTWRDRPSGVFRPSVIGKPGGIGNLPGGEIVGQQLHPEGVGYNNRSAPDVGGKSKQNGRCFVCRRLGHLARDCAYRSSYQKMSDVRQRYKKPIVRNVNGVRQPVEMWYYPLTNEAEEVNE